MNDESSDYGRRVEAFYDALKRQGRGEYWARKLARLYARLFGAA